MEGFRHRGNPQAERKVHVFRHGAPTEDLQEATIDRVMERFEDELEIIYVSSRDYPNIWELIGGEKCLAGALIGDTMMKDLVTIDQWTEALFGEFGLFERESKLERVSLYDAHEHVMPGGAERWWEIAEDNGVERSVLLPLPNDIHYAGLDAANEYVLEMAQQRPQQLIPLVILPPEDEKNADNFSSFVRRGVRGLKLMSGHAEYFFYNEQSRLDTPELMGVFADCEQRGLPVLWHVNHPLFDAGFLRVLEAFPKLTVINPHFGGYLTASPDDARSLLLRHPNLFFDVSLGGNVEWLRRSLEELSSGCEDWRRLFMEFSDRICFGVDLVVTGQMSRAHAAMMFELMRSLLEKDSYDFRFFGALGYNTLGDESHYVPGLRGLALPEDVLEQVYFKTAERVYGVPGQI